MENQQSRLKSLRKTLNLNQSEFAKKLGITYSTISKIETGSQLTDQNIKTICLTFGVSEQWLRTGEGAMFVSDDPDTDTFLAIYRALSPSFRKIFLDYGRFLIEQQAALPNAPAP